MTYKLRKDPINEIPKAQFIFWIIVRISMIICAVYSFVTGDVVMGFESIFCFIFSHLWDMFQVFGHTSFIIDVPPLSQTMLNVIIFVGIVFGSILCIFCRVLCVLFSDMILLALASGKKGNVPQLLRHCSA